MTETWPDQFVKALIVSGFALLWMAALFMAINAYLLKKPGRNTTQFKAAAEIMFGLWFLNNIALGIFGTLTKWFVLAKWEIWVAYGVSFLIGIGIVVLSRLSAVKEDRRLLAFVLLLVAALVSSGVFLVASLTG